MFKHRKLVLEKNTGYGKRRDACLYCECACCQFKLIMHGKGRERSQGVPFCCFSSREMIFGDAVSCTRESFNLCPNCPTALTAPTAADAQHSAVQKIPCARDGDVCHPSKVSLVLFPQIYEYIYSTPNNPQHLPRKSCTIPYLAPCDCSLRILIIS